MKRCHEAHFPFAAGLTGVFFAQALFLGALTVAAPGDVVLTSASLVGAGTQIER
jgi:hypothetical protein